VDAQITALLHRVREGDPSASDPLMQAVYGELRRIAGRHLRNERVGHTLQPTALVNEVYVKLFGAGVPEVADRAHFLAIASRIMRSILVDHGRARAASKRGGEAQQVTFDMDLPSAGDAAHPACDEAHVEDALVSLLDLHLAMEALAVKNPIPAQVIEMRYFGGMTAEETAAVVGRSVHIVQHDLRFAHAWLRRRLARPTGEQQ
jgi:RNA polymerase sigma-70 factor (ECF subfamily)